jgi:Right handed beta helix region
MSRKHTRRNFLALSGLGAAALAADAFLEPRSAEAANTEGGTTFYVASTGSDQNLGSSKLPFRTIQQAANVMQPGDTCLVRGGLYREWVKPSRGGASEFRRISYKAYPGETPVITGSERITQWMHQGNGVWMVALSQSFFGDFNPYTMPIYGDLKSRYKLPDDQIFLRVGQTFHLGAVYSDGVPYFETLTKDEVLSAPKTWYTETADNVTRIWANFANDDPNTQLSEINVRECVFFPEVAGLSYITVIGFSMRHSACCWASPATFQRGLIGTHYGRSWIIEHCHITDAKCVGICSGTIDTGHCEDTPDIQQIGHHIVRNNLIERCGEAGIAGLVGFAASLIENNLIQDINVQAQFGGAETAGIKVHRATDLVISHNIIRRVFSSEHTDAPGIWIDWSNQGVRITGNVVYDIEYYAIFLEANHGPLLFDHNIIAGSSLASGSERIILAHNLFCDSGILYENYDKRFPSYYQPHTLKEIKKASMTKIEDRYYNNLFIGRGFDRLRGDTRFEPQEAYIMRSEPLDAKDFRSAGNLYYGAMPRQSWEDKASENSGLDATCHLRDLANGVIVNLSVDDSALSLKCPFVDTNFIGSFSIINQGMEHPDGSPIALDHDYFDKRRDAQHPRVGPFEQLRPGGNVFTITAG